MFKGEPATAQDRASAELPTQDRASLSAFLEIVRQPSFPASLAAFRACLYCYTPEMLQAVPGEPERDVQLHLVWEIGNMDRIPGELDRHITLRLPLHLPDDFAAHTHVAVAK